MLGFACGALPLGRVWEAVFFYNIYSPVGAILTLGVASERVALAQSASRRRWPGFSASTDPGREWHSRIAQMIDQKAA